jgi:hypothetical protein
MEDHSEELLSAQAMSLFEVHRQASGDYARASKAEATWRAYCADLEDFAVWCIHHSVVALPAEPSCALHSPAQEFRGT